MRDRILAIATSVGEMTAEKNAAYGDSFAKCEDIIGALYPDGIRPEQFRDALGVVRVVDKLFRIANRKDAFGESPWRDIAGYGVIGAAADEKDKAPSSLCHSGIHNADVEISPTSLPAPARVPSIPDLKKGDYYPKATEAQESPETSKEEKIEPFTVQVFSNNGCVRFMRRFEFHLDAERAYDFALAEGLAENGDTVKLWGAGNVLAARIV